MGKLYGVIPAAGKGTRARPYTTLVPKCMLKVNGVPNIERTIAIMRDDLGIKDIIIVVGYLGHVIQKHLGDGSQHRVNLKFIVNEHLDRGLAYSVLLVKEYIDDYFCVMLSDECYIRTNHADLIKEPYRDYLFTIGSMHVDDRESIQRNYTVELDGDNVTRLVEKPTQIETDILGTGTFILSPELLQHLKKEFQKVNMVYVEFVTFLNELIQRGFKSRYFNMTGTYVNINDRDSLNLAKYSDRSNYFHTYKVDLLIYSEGTEKNIAFAIKRYKKVASIHKIDVILPYDNEIENIVRSQGVGVIKCPAHITLYGEKIKYAMQRAAGDILILAEADYSFPRRDIPKLLTYLKEADMVVGTRTTRQLIEQGSDMRGVVRMANVFLAKLLELLWWNKEARFTDVGCTFRAIWRHVFFDIEGQLRTVGPEFSVEMMIAVLEAQMRVIEIPVNYFNRSQSLALKYQKANTFFRMLSTIIGCWFRSKFGS